MKREGISTLFIHGYQWDLSYLVFRSLAFDFHLLEMVVCVCVFENVLKKKRPCLGNRCNNSLLECFTKVCIFSKRCFKCFWKLF